MSLLDEIRSDLPETWNSRTTGGFDPDLTTSGLARFRQDVSSRGRRRPVSLELWTLRRRGRKTGLAAAQGMVETVQAHADLFIADEATVETQQSYPDPTQSRAEIIATANDLIMIAQVSGAATTAFLRSHTDVYMMLPSNWKGNRKKSAMHREIASFCAKFQVEVLIEGTVASLDNANIHTMDAAGMALRRAGYRV